MFHIGQGITVYYYDDKELVILENGIKVQYEAGQLVVEMIKNCNDELIKQKIENRIRCFPDRNYALSRNSVVDGFKWVYDVIDEDKNPTVAELFRSELSDIMFEKMTDEAIYSDVGFFLDECYKEYLRHLECFGACVELMTAKRGEAETLNDELKSKLEGEIEEAYETYGKKCKTKKIDGGVIVDAYNIRNLYQLLVFEWCRLKKTKYKLRKCANCGRYFIIKKDDRIMYCSSKAPQYSNKTCREIGPQIRRREKRNQNKEEKEYQRKYSKICMAKRRAKTREESSYFEKCLSDLINERKKENEYSD